MVVSHATNIYFMEYRLLQFLLMLWLPELHLVLIYEARLNGVTHVCKLNHALINRTTCTLCIYTHRYHHTGTYILSNRILKMLRNDGINGGIIYYATSLSSHALNAR